MTIESDIIAWGLERPGWQQEVLLALANGEEYAAEAIRELSDKILAGRHSVPSEDAKSLAVKSPVVEQVTLSDIADVHGVNALIDGQLLSFGASGLTVVYGDNGSGKSGYARLIKATVNARHRSEILSNVFLDTPGSPSGVLHYRIAGNEQALMFPAPPPPEFLKMSFYDEHCGDEYLTKESTISYRPSALTLIDGLIQVCDDVRSDLAAQIKDNEGTALILDLPEATPAHAFVSTITDATTSEQVDTAISLPPDITTRLAAALGEEARLASSNPQEEKVRLANLAGQIRTLGEGINELVNFLSVEQTIARAKLRAAAMTARQAATLAATRSFDDEPLPGVGSETWRALWSAAREYSTAEAYHEHQFPVIDDRSVCVLCQQPLGDGAKQRLQRFEQYMTDTTERDAVDAERAFATSMEELRGLEFATAAQVAALASLDGHDKQLGADARDLLAKGEEHRRTVVQFLISDNPSPLPLPEGEVTDQLRVAATSLLKLSAGTDVAQFKATLNEVKLVRTELQAQVRLSESVEKIKAELVRRAELMALKKARTAADTGAITQKAAALTRQYATDRILDQFIRETERLGLERVTLEDLGGRKGRLNQRPGLLGATKGVGARNVLSEGEQTALGLAGFFTEAIFDESKSAIIFDDPVTSLDHVRRDRVAERLAQLAKDRQVVVFTHDVVFTGNLTSAASREGVALIERAIERRGIDPGVCIESFPWKVKDFGSRLNHLTNELVRLIKERPELVQGRWEERVATWAGYLSETWERCVTTEIMNEVFDRGSSEVKMMKFRVLAAITAADDQDLQEGYNATSRWGRRHDKAAETNYVAPEPQELQRELDRLVKWQKRMKKYRS